MLLGYHSSLFFLCFSSFFPSFCGLVNHSLLGCRDSQPLYFLILIVRLFFSLLTAAAEILHFFLFPPSFVISFFFICVFFYFARNRDILTVDKIRGKTSENYVREQFWKVADVMTGPKLIYSFEERSLSSSRDLSHWKRSMTH